MDESALLNLESDLDALRSSFDRGEMQAFGPKQDKILKTIELLRSDQVFLSVSHMELEIAHRVEPDDAQSYTQFGERQFERLTQAFAERERAVARLSQKLHYLGEAIDRANEDCE
eukprot:TRINITY_DN15367_c0_g1_i1.p1 TRINITY_DN15367_c0_g1~~TRINITY_DN15367_c0_g1_i1.p1  ORF type:complete len:131 (+),score=44.26 TRINITY_DN15367_c0_g1_i1:51-395(+)